MTHQPVGGNDVFEERPFLGYSGQPVTRQIPQSFRGEANLVRTTDGFGHVQIKNSAYGPGTYGAIDADATFNRTLKPHQMVMLYPVLLNEGAIDPMCNPQDGCATKCSSPNKCTPGIAGPYNGPHVAPEQAFPNCNPRPNNGPGGPVVDRSCDNSTARNPNLHFNQCHRS